MKSEAVPEKGSGKVNNKEKEKQKEEPAPQSKQPADVPPANDAEYEYYDEEDYGEENLEEEVASQNKDK